jgi:tRNA-specific 2-thiouridylase
MKFGLLLDRARAQGLAFDRFATGHYARVEQDSASGRWLLRRAVDLAKDQSYFLSRLSQEQLRAVLFPLGGLTKPQVKAIARELGWADVADKPESQNFIESKHYGVLFGTEEQPGPIMDLRGNELGRHRGIAHYTVGQRKGLGLGGTVDPLYVIRIDACSNTVIVGPRATLLADRLVADDLNWIGLASGPREPLRIQCKIRQQHQEAAATLRMLPPSPVSGRVEHKPVDSPDMLGGSAGASPSQRIDKPFGASVFREGEPPGEPRGKASQVVAEVVFDEPQMAITPGQTAVFYDQDRVLGSGIIVSERTNSSNRSTS